MGIAGTPELSLELATGSAGRAAAQGLRYRVFVEEMGAAPRVHSPGREHDYYDPLCEHLIVRHRASAEIVGTYRVLTADNARRVGAFCSEREFDLTRLGHLRRRLIELSRACVDPAHRSGAAPMLLWSGIAALARERGASHLTRWADESASQVASLIPCVASSCSNVSR